MNNEKSNVGAGLVSAQGTNQNEDNISARWYANQKGITLIALIITIIILLILATVTLSMLIGENGIIERANTASQKSKESQALEELRIMVLDANIQKEGNANLHSVIDYLKSDKENKYIFSLSPDFSDSENFPDEFESDEIYVIYKEYKFKIDSNLIVELIGRDNINSENQLQKDSLVFLEHFDNNNGVIISSDKITTQEKKVGNSSLYLNDTRVSDNYTKRFEFSGDFTLEYYTKISNENLNYTWSVHLAVNNSNGLLLGLNNGKYVVRGNGVQNYLTLDPPPVDEWVHIAISRKDGNLKVFYNGILKGSIQNVTNFTNGSLCIGYDGNNIYSKNTYIDELKISPNTGKYENNFDVKDSITNTDDIIYHFENDNKLCENFATQSTTEKRFGSSSYYFDNSYSIYKSKNEDFKLSGDFTVDYWIKQDNKDLNKEWTVHLAINATNGLLLGIHNGKYVVRGNTIQDYLVVDPPPMDEWVHVAVTRKDGVIYVFYNGILQGSAKNTTEFANGNLYIAQDSYGYFFITNTYIDELRILNGYCQWTENFTISDKSYEY